MSKLSYIRITCPHCGAPVKVVKPSEPPVTGTATIHAQCLKCGRYFVVEYTYIVDVRR